MPWLMEPPRRKHTALPAHLQVAHLPATHIRTAAHMLMLRWFDRMV